MTGRLFRRYFVLSVFDPVMLKKDIVFLAESEESRSNRKEKTVPEHLGMRPRSRILYELFVGDLCAKQYHTRRKKSI